LDLEDAKLVATMAPVIEDAHQSFQSDAGMEGSALPEALVDRLKAAYSLTGGDGKTRVPGSSTALASAMSIDFASAEFITGARNLPDWDAVAGRKRNLFDENRATLQALVYSEISKVAAESGIGKLDSVKVEAPRAVRGRRATARKNGSTVKADPTSARDLRDHVDAATAALGGSDDAGLRDALRAAVALAAADPSIRRSTRAAIVGLLDEHGLSDTQAACIRLASLASQPDSMRALGHILNAHLDDALAALPAPPAEPDETAETESDGGGDGEEGDNGEEVDPSASGGDAAEPSDDAPPAPDAAPSEDVETPNPEPDAEAPSAETGDGHDPPATDGDDASDDAAPPPTDDPVAFHSEPFPALPVLAASVQRRLLTTLKAAGATWLTDKQVTAILTPPDPEPASAADGEESAGDADEDVEANANESVEADVADDGATAGEGNQDAPDEPDAAQDAIVEETTATADERDEADDGSGASEADEDANAADGEATADDASAEDEEADAPAPAHPDAHVVRAYQVALVDSLWQVADTLQRTGVARGGKYTATLQFKGPLDQLVNFVHKLETQKPWMRVTAMRIAIDNADQPMLSLTLTLEATVL